ncbi:MAG: hypothetical protein ACTH7Q_15525 [Pseudoalteromonas sp.]
MIDIMPVSEPEKYAEQSMSIPKITNKTLVDMLSKGDPYLFNQGVLSGRVVAESS